MCPGCLATMGLYLTGAVSVGGITTQLAARVLRRPDDRHPDESTAEPPRELNPRSKEEDR